VTAANVGADVAARCMAAMERQVQLKRQVNVHRSSEERKHAQREAHQEAQEIKVRPRHKNSRTERLPGYCVDARAS
jgi:hypothetical protein